MEVGVGQFDVTQCRHLEGETVRILAGDCRTAFGGVGGLIGFDHAHALEGGAARGRAIVASHTADGLEGVVTGQLLLGNGLVVTLEPLVEA